MYVTARNPELGEKAVLALEKEGLKPHFHQLDISDKASVEALRDHLKKEHGGLDILINNAAIAYKVNCNYASCVLSLHEFTTLSCSQRFCQRGQMGTSKNSQACI